MELIIEKVHLISLWVENPLIPFSMSINFFKYKMHRSASLRNTHNIIDVEIVFWKKLSLQPHYYLFCFYYFYSTEQVWISTLCDF